MQIMCLLWIVISKYAYCSYMNRVINYNWMDFDELLTPCIAIDWGPHVYMHDVWYFEYLCKYSNRMERG